MIQHKSITDKVMVSTMELHYTVRMQKIISAQYKTISL